MSKHTIFRIIILCTFFLPSPALGSVSMIGFSLQTTPGIHKAIKPPTYHRVKARKGDGAYALLRRYGLLDHGCNLTKFYELNQLDRKAHLKVGSYYYLPILLYDYNGKSIRSTIGIEEWQRAVRIQKYNERMLEERLRRMTFQRSRILWVPFHELDCGGKVPSEVNQASDGEIPESETEEEPAETAVGSGVMTTNNLATLPVGDRNYPIFGKKHAYTPLVSNRLRGQVYYVVAGHGGPDPGAMSKAGKHVLCEDEYAYDVALRMCRLLIAEGATAYMITRDRNDGIRDGKYLGCDYDEVLWGNVRMKRAHKPRLFQRSDIINHLYEKHKQQGVAIQRLVSIHIDSRNSNMKTDLFFYYFPGDAEGKKLADNMRQSMRANYRKYQPNRRYEGSVSARDLHMLRETLPASAYVEIGNIANKRDQQRIILHSNRQALAQWMFEGLTK